MHDFLIIGGGVIGLSLAWELANRGKQVCIVDRQQLGRETSWVGAGIFPPPLAKAKHDALEQLRAESHLLHRAWSKQLLDATGIDNGLRESGGIYFARDSGEAASLRGAMQWAEDDGVVVESVNNDRLIELEPSLDSVASQVKAAFHLPEEMQLRSPHHLQALIQACSCQAVELRQATEIESIRVRGDRVSGVVATDGESLSADQVVLCCGPWIAELVQPLGVNVPVEPWRGQLILWKQETQKFSHVINEGLRYFVPRDDGYLLVGATVEDVGFDRTNTQEAIDELREYSYSVLPELRNQDILQAWAGLWPKTPDGLPFMDRIPGLTNLSIAAGHYRSGLHLSTGSAVFMADLLLHDTPPPYAEAFRLSR